MSRSPCFQYLVAMSFRAPYVGQRRGFANGGGRGRLVSGDSHFRSVRDTNHELRQGNFSNQSSTFQPPLYSNNNNNNNNNHHHHHHQNRQLRPPPPYHQNQQFRPPPSYNRNPQFRRPPLQFDQNPGVRPRPRPRPPKPLDYRNWEYAKTSPPPDSKRFVILSYNILADYLALSHRKLYFHIPRHMLDWEWRKKNILFELGLWSADIMCFQEVDRFQDLEVELKLRGYCGIWKMRTGNAIDGCAIFWRASRFKLLYEEGIEFNKLGLRENVAQICVFELLSQNCSEDPEAPLKSTAHLNKVVVCNIHVLYNPKRGEIKLGQIRTLMDKAHAVSKIWNDAPVVLSGDFNCTPKSSLYNFIVEQKLDLSSVDRDKVSGQASAEIRTPPKLYPRVQADSSIPAPSTVGSGEVGSRSRDLLSDNLKCDEDGNAEVYPSVNCSSRSQSTDTVLDVSDKTGCNLQYPNKDSTGIEANKESQQTLVDSSKGETGSAFFIPTDSLTDSPSCFQGKGEVSTNQDQINEENHKLSHQTESHHEDDSQVTQLGFGDKANTSTNTNLGSMSEHSESNKIAENKSMHCNNSTISPGHDCPSSVESNSEFISASNSQYPVEVSSASSGINFVLADKLENLSLQELDETRTEGGCKDEDDNTFLSASHNAEDAFQSDFDKFVTSNLDETTEELVELADDLSPTRDSGAIDMEETTYNPSLWTAMEIATATGNADCTLLEHPLQLTSTYTEVEDCAGTRDSNGEPMVTSYNRCFMGTVDYIWRSEGLQTVRVLAPIPKHAMQWTSGFPTKKWGSDHIALVSELAFIKD